MNQDEVDLQKAIPERQKRYVPDWSQFKVYSIGIVAEDKEDEYTHEIFVLPIEITPDYTGELMHSEQEVEIEGHDRYKQEYTVTLDKSTTITAEWIALFGGHRKTSPNVKRGERVLLWRYAEEDKFYWTTMGMDEHLRRLEHITWAFSAEPDEENELEYDKNLYYLTLSTRDKYIKFRTSGPQEGSHHDEPYVYTFYWDTGDGYFYFQDDDDVKRGMENPNRFYFNSEERIIYLINSDETQVRIDKEDIYFHCHNDITGEVGNDAELIIGNDIEARIGNDATIKIGNDLDAEVVNNASVHVGANIDAEVGGSINAQVGTGSIPDDPDVERDGPHLDPMDDHKPNLHPKGGNQYARPLSSGGNVDVDINGYTNIENVEHVRWTAPEMQFGEDDAVQPSTLGDNQAKACDALINKVNESYVIGNLGVPTSTIIEGSGPVEETGGDQLQPGGDVYSKVNTNQ